LDNETSYVSNLTRSLSLVLDEFYKNIKVCLTDRHCRYDLSISTFLFFKFVGLSSITGAGVGEFFDVVKLAVDEYET
jgi:hypothetical protein